MFRAVWSLIFLMAVTPTSFALLTTESNSAIPGEGLQAEGDGEWQRAVSIYLSRLSTNPTSVDLWLRVATIEHQLKNYTLAINAYRHVISLHPDDPVFHKTLSEIYAEINQPAEALVEINEAVKLKPTDIDYLLARSKIANWNKKLDIALDSNQRVFELSSNKKVTFDTLQLLTQIGDLHGQLHHYPDAIKAYQQAIKINPNNPVLYQALSQIYASSNDSAHALTTIEQALSLDPTNINYLNSKAILAAWLKNNSLALQTYQQVLKLSPNNKEALKGRALVEHLINISIKNPELIHLSPLDQLMNDANNEALSHRYDLAAYAIKKAIILKPKSSILYKKLSEVYASAHQPLLALKAINNAILLAPKNIEYMRAKAKLSAWAGDKIQTLDSYQRILELKPYDQDAMLNLAHALAWLGRTDAAIHAYQTCLRVYPHMAEGWMQYADVVSWTANYIASFDALKHYKQLKGETTQYLETKARVLALTGRFKSALVINEPLLRKEPNDPYILSTEVIASSKAFQIKNAVYYLKKVVKISPNDPRVKGLKQIILTPLRSNMNVEADYTAASDTTGITDIPVSAQYFLSPQTSLLFQGLYERATAAVGSRLDPVNGGTSISDESAKVGFSTQIASLNLKGLLGGLKIQNKNNHGIYDALVNTNLGEKAQITLENLHDLYRPYLVPQSPKLISLQIMETRTGAYLQWQPFVQKYLNVAMSYSDLTDNNNYLHFNAWPKARIYGSERWLVTVGVDGDFWRYKRRATDGYYSPLHFDGYEGTVELYYSQSEMVGYSVSGGFGMQKDETFPHYFYEEDLAAQMFWGIFTDWELQAKGGYTLRLNPMGNYHCWSAGLILTRRFK